MPKAPTLAELSCLSGTPDPVLDTSEAVAVMTCTITDWNPILNAMAAAQALATEQEVLLREQATTREALAAKLQKALDENHQLKTQLQEVRAQVEVRARQIQVLAEARLHNVEERARVAELRAEAAECWLRRIDEASRDLLPGDERAAA